ncbi:hypothetical protein KAI04_00630 [Candidatus Pacearchaeota archaeon]|nr:hypothetical protein [Candidatus Pacearchaeota archaeon]
MRRTILSLIFLILLVLTISTISADVIITQQPNEVYNLGDVVNLPMKITTAVELPSSIFKINLICNGIETLVYQEFLVLSTGEEAERNPKIPLMQELIGRPTGTCVLKAILDLETFELTESFTISDYVTISITEQKSEAAPEENIVLEGNAIKDNGENVQGIGEIRIIKDNETIIELTDTVKNGYFYFNFSFPKDSQAGQYLVQLNIYENDNLGEKTNKGFINYNLLIAQVPTSLEVIFDTPKVEPGTDLKVKTILHDQTGVPIETTSIITIKNDNQEIIEQVEKSTGEFLEFPIAYNEPAAEWEIVALSNKITTEASFEIIEKEDIEIVLINRTITILNTGNIPYCNKSVLIKIGNDSLNVDVCLEVDQEQEYILTAPEGEYQVDIISEGEEKISQSVMLTGRAIDVKAVSGKNFINRPLVWIFLIGILGFVAFLFFKKGYKRNFIGYVTKRKKSKTSTQLTKGSLLNTKNKAELSLSIKGDKQNVSVICLKIKNLQEISSKKGIVEESLQKIINLVEEKKAYVYENNENIFFIFAPVNTKTFSNEKSAVDVAQKISNALTEGNKIYKDKINFGIGLNYGTIIAKKEKGTFQFMSMGTLITTAKKTANASKGDLLLGEKMNDKLRTQVKTEKEMHGNTELYRIKEIKTRGDHKNFLSNFVKKLEKDKKEQEAKKLK